MLSQNVKCPSFLLLTSRNNLFVDQTVDEWIEQLWDIYTMEYYLATKEKKLLPFATVWMNLENIMLSEIGQSEKDKYHMISVICGV